MSKVVSWCSEIKVIIAFYEGRVLIVRVVGLEVKDRCPTTSTAHGRPFLRIFL